MELWKRVKRVTAVRLLSGTRCWRQWPWPLQLMEVEDSRQTTNCSPSSRLHAVSRSFCPVSTGVSSSWGRTWSTEGHVSGHSEAARCHVRAKCSGGYHTPSAMLSKKLISCLHVTKSNMQMLPLLIVMLLHNIYNWISIATLQKGKWRLSSIFVHIDLSA